MYGVVAQHPNAGASRPRPQRAKESNGAVQDNETRGHNSTHLTWSGRIIKYVKRKLNPKEEDQLEEFDSRAVGRHRPEHLDKLTRATNFSRGEIKLIYRGFKQECPTGMVDEERFKNIFSQFFPLGDASNYAHYVFNTIKHKQTGKVNFEEFLSILSRVSRGTVQEKLAWIFALYDIDGDGKISKSEMVDVVTAIYDMLGRCTAPAVDETTARDHVDRIFHLIDSNRDGVVTPDELYQWCARDPRFISSFDTLDTIL